MNKNKAFKIIDKSGLKEQNKNLLKDIFNALTEPDCKHNDLSLRDDGQHECLNCGELFSVKMLR